MASRYPTTLPWGRARVEFDCGDCRIRIQVGDPVGLVQVVTGSQVVATGEMILSCSGPRWCCRICFPGAQLRATRVLGRLASRFPLGGYTLRSTPGGGQDG